MAKGGGRTGNRSSQSPPVQGNRPGEVRPSAPGRGPAEGAFPSCPLGRLRHTPGTGTGHTDRASLVALAPMGDVASPRWVVRISDLALSGGARGSPCGASTHRVHLSMSYGGVRFVSPSTSEERKASARRGCSDHVVYCPQPPPASSAGWYGKASEDVGPGPHSSFPHKLIQFSCVLTIRFAACRMRR